jgi:hypothetical protein
MSAPELSPDLNGWPSDPYRLLGVPHGVSPRDLRRAYTRLIRTYKPEQYPEHFRRIREAYETVLRHVELFAQWSDPEPAPEPTESVSADAPPAGPKAHEPDRRPAELEELPRLPTREDELRELWTLACAGEEATAYQRLRALYDQRPGQMDVCLRLYWLLALYPELDTLRPACDWLVQALRGNGLAGPARELYRRELADDPLEALSPSCTSLLECSARPDLMAGLVEWRWQAAQRLRRWRVIAEDLERLRPLLADDEDGIRVRLLLAAADHLAWAREKDLRDQFEECIQELEQAQHLDPGLRAQLDRLDYLRELAVHWRRLRPGKGVVGALHYLIPLSWGGSFPEFEPQLDALLELIAGQPERALRDLDELHRTASSVLAQLGEVLGQLRDRMELPPDPPVSPAVARPILDFLDETAWSRYRQLRPRLLTYCLHEAIAPELVARVVEGRPSYQMTAEKHLADRLMADWPLRLVCLAARLFGASAA